MADSTYLPISELKKLVAEAVSDFDVSYMDTTLPSTGDGSATRWLMREFCHSKANQGMSEASLYQYMTAIKMLVGYCKKEITLIDHRDINMFIEHYRMTGVQSTTVKNKYELISSVFSWLTIRHYIAENPMLMVDKVKTEQKFKKPLTQSEIEMIKVAIEHKGNLEEQKKNMAMFYFMLDTGVRVSELCSIKVSDCNFKDKTVVVMGKESKEREVYFTDKTVVRMNEYFRVRPDMVDGYSIDCPLIASLRGHHTIVPYSVQTTMKQLGELSGVTRLHPHLIRATMATNLANKGVPITSIAKLLGHVDLSSINRYVLVSNQSRK